MKLKETRGTLLASYNSNIIMIEVYALLFEENSSNNLDFPYYYQPSKKAKVMPGAGQTSGWKSTTCSSNSAILCMRPGNSFRRNRRALQTSEAYIGSHMSNSWFSGDVISLCKLGFRHVGAHARCEIVSNCKEICALTIKVFK